MKRKLLTPLLLMFLSSQTFAQLTNTQNFSTGWNNAGSGSVIANGQQDDNWQVVGMTLPHVSPLPLGYHAFVQNPWSFAPVTPANTKWISYDTSSMSNYYHNVPGNSTATMTLRYTFETCGNDTINFNAAIRSDNQITNLRIDGVPTGFSQLLTSNNWIAGSSFSYTKFMNSGTHSIEVDIFNPSGPTGLNVDGTITSASSSVLVDRANFPNWVCNNTPISSSCNDTCYWKVTGNTVLSGNNIFGTNSNDDIKIRTNGMDRGVIKNGNGQTGGFFGWNTMNPTARLHVNCVNGDTGIGRSDIRFEQLEQGAGNILVIDQQGYVYNGNVDLTVLLATIQNMQNEIDTLKSLLNSSSKQKTLISNQNKLFQNSPNPFTNETVIEYYVHELNQSASITINDLNGRMLQRYPIPAKGKGSITIQAHNMASGMYLYSLIIDGREVDTKKMVIEK